MSNNNLKNRLFHPVPKNCPLSEAICWIAAGALPLSFSDISKTRHHPLLPFLGNSPHSYTLYNYQNEKIEVSNAELIMAKDQLLISLINNELDLYGHLSETIKISIPRPVVSSIPPPPSTSIQLDIWKKIIKEKISNKTIRDQPVKIPTDLLNWDYSSWMNNNLACPHEITPGYSFSQLFVSTKNLFSHFAEKGYLSKREMKVFGVEPNPPIKTQGRPRLVNREIWLEELIVMFLSGEIIQGETRDSISHALSVSIKENLDVDISSSTIKRDWIRELFKKADERRN